MYTTSSKDRYEKMYRVYYMPIIAITRKNLLKDSRKLLLDKIDINQVENGITQQIRANSTVVLLLDDTKKMNSKCCSKVLKKPKYPSFNVVMNQKQYTKVENQCKVYKRQQALRILHMNRVPTNIANEYMNAVEKCGCWKPKT